MTGKLRAVRWLVTGRIHRARSQTILKISEEKEDAVSLHLMPDGRTMESDEDQQPAPEPRQEPEESQPSYVPGGGRPGHPDPTPPEPDPVTGPPAFDTDLSPYLTHRITHYATPPSTDEEAKRRRRTNRKRQGERFRKVQAISNQCAIAARILKRCLTSLTWDCSTPSICLRSVAPDWPGSIPLSQGQDLHVDHLLSIEDDTMVREMLIGIKRDGIPPKAFVNDYLSQFAEWGWNDLSGARTLQMLESVRNSDWDDFLAQADTEIVETVAQDLADNTIEELTVIDAKSGRVLFNRTGVLGASGSQYVGLQDYEVDAFAGLDLIFVHNHPNGTDASDEDLRSAFDAGAEMLMVVTPKGYEYVYIRSINGMVRVRAEEASYKVGPGTAAEHVLLEARSWEQARRNHFDPPEFVFLQSDPEVIANMDVYPQEIARYEELKDFVNTGIDELQEFGEKELLAKIGESIDLVQDIFGYTVRFHDKYDVRTNVELAMEQVYNLGTILFHFLNDLGNEIMESTPAGTIYILGADERIRQLHDVDDYAFRGHVALPESTAIGNPDLNRVYLGSEIEAGAIGHEVAHEIDRRMGDYGTVKAEYQEGSDGKWKTISEVAPTGSLLWYMKNQVVNQRVNLPKGHELQGYNFAEAKKHLPEGSRAASEMEKDYVREIFADLLAAKVLGPFEDFYSRDGAAVPIGFKKNSFGAADIAIAIEQYFDNYDDFLTDGSPEPETFGYTKNHDHQTYGQLEWPVMPVQGDEK